MIKQFLLKGFIFALIFILINVGLIYCYNHFVLADSLLRKKETAFQENQEQLDFLFLGDSHVAAAVNTKIIPKSFNYATSGESYLQNYFKLKAIPDERLTQIETIVLPLDFHSFCSFRKVRLIDEGYWANKGNLMNLAIKNREAAFFRMWIKGRFFPYMGEFKMMQTAWSIKTGKIAPQIIVDGVEQRLGQFVNNKNATADLQLTLERHFKESVVFDPSLKEYFAHISNYCDNKDKNLILVHYPVTEQYYKQTSQFINPEIYQTELSQIMANLPSKVRVLDFSQLFEKDPQYFSDADHLNKEGAENFSKIMRDSLLN